MSPVTLAELDPVTRQRGLEQIPDAEGGATETPASGLATVQQETCETLDPANLTNDQLADIVIEVGKKLRDCAPYIRALKVRFDLGDRDSSNRLKVPIKGCDSWYEFCDKHLNRTTEAVRQAMSADSPCPHCGELDFSSWGSSRDKHIRQVHQSSVPTQTQPVRPAVVDPNAKPTECPHCGEHFPSRGTFHRHVADKHADIVNPVGYTCSACGAAFPTVADIQQHRKTGHRPPPPYSNLEPELDSPEELSKQERAEFKTFLPELKVGDKVFLKTRGFLYSYSFISSVTVVTDTHIVTELLEHDYGCYLGLGDPVFFRSGKHVDVKNRGQRPQIFRLATSEDEQDIIAFVAECDAYRRQHRLESQPQVEPNPQPEPTTPASTLTVKELLDWFNNTDEEGFNDVEFTPRTGACLGQVRLTFGAVTPAIAKQMAEYYLLCVAAAPESPTPEPQTKSKAKKMKVSAKSNPAPAVKHLLRGHVEPADITNRAMWCGAVKGAGYRLDVRNVTCPRCLAALAAATPEEKRNAVQMIADTFNISYAEGLKELAKRYDITSPEELASLQYAAVTP